MRCCSRRVRRSKAHRADKAVRHRRAEIKRELFWNAHARRGEGEPRTPCSAEEHARNNLSIREIEVNADNCVGYLRGTLRGS